jgi:hypothetical protein
MHAQKPKKLEQISFSLGTSMKFVLWETIVELPLGLIGIIDRGL